MSKELTEQLGNGTLSDGCYYVLSTEDDTPVACDIDTVCEFMIRDVIAPVPNYHDLCELKQELEICKDEKADLYAKLCNALMQLEEANKVIANFRTYDFTRDDELAEEYQVKYGISGEKIYINRKSSKEFEYWRKKITKSLKKKLKSGV